MWRKQTASDLAPLYKWVSTIINKEIIVSNKLGLHARAAAKLVERACRYSSKIWLVRGTRKVDGKSILNVMTLGATQGTIITLIAEGEDESEAIADLESLINRKFDEME